MRLAEEVFPVLKTLYLQELLFDQIMHGLNIRLAGLCAREDAPPPWKIFSLRASVRA